ncbi:Porphobilinogen deaminase [Gossypium arboreum]|uniref:Porphobilinogen deaminase n=1 Tax=Gossypium arboreum TaxID=29729 RepID=A0A0B0NVT7_GOSAR|nr:Porphobilinogen deaminase [Gossypium arboreum]
MQWIEPKLQDTVDWKETTSTRRVPKQIKTWQDRASLVFLESLCSMPVAR